MTTEKEVKTTITKEELVKIVKSEFAKMIKDGKPKNVGERTAFLNLFKSDILNIIDKGFSVNQIHKVLQDKAGYVGSYQTLRSVINEWKGTEVKEKNGAVAKKETTKVTPTEPKEENKTSPSSPKSKPKDKTIVNEEESDSETKLKI